MRSGRNWAILFAILLPLWAVANAPAPGIDFLQAALQENQPYRNAVYLFLRIAGAVWIAVEWVAAMLLWRAYRMLANAVAERA